MKKLIGSLTVVAALVIASVAPISAQSVTTDSPVDLRAVTDQVQIDIGTAMKNLPSDVLSKLEEAKKSVADMRTQLTVVGLNSDATDLIYSQAQITTDLAFANDLSKLEGVPEEVISQIRNAQAEISASISARAEEIKLVVK